MPESDDILRCMTVVPYLEDYHRGTPPSDEEGEEYDESMLCSHISGLFPAQMGIMLSEILFVTASQVGWNLSQWLIPFV